MDITQIEDALQTVQSGLAETAQPATDQQLMLFGTDGTPVAKVSAAGLSAAAYGTCSTAADVTAKAVTIAGFILIKGALASVQFANAVDTASPTLNVSSTGAKPIYYRGAALQSGIVRPGFIATMQYDGTRWNVLFIEGQQQGAAPSTLWEDLGLPSGLLWARRNIDVGQTDGFAAEAESAGSFYQWGATQGYSPDTSVADNVAFSGIADFSSSTYGQLPAASVTASLAASIDMARSQLGTPWRVPTADEFQELYDYCTWTWQAQNGQNGYLLTSKLNGKTIFLPATGRASGTAWNDHGTSGHYWASTFESSSQALSLSFTSSAIVCGAPDYRYQGLAIRPVY